MILKRVMYNNTIKSIKIDEKTIDVMADHLVGKKLSIYREGILDADGDSKVTLADFIHRIKNIKGTEENDKISTSTITPGSATTTTTTGGGY